MKMGGDILMIRTGNELAQKIAKLASDKKAEDIGDAFSHGIETHSCSV